MTISPLYPCGKSCATVSVDRSAIIKSKSIVKQETNGHKSNIAALDFSFQSHIIELANVTVPGLTCGSLEDVLVQGGYVKRAEINAKQITNGHVAAKEHNARDSIMKQTPMTMPRQIPDAPKAANNVSRVANDNSRPDLDANTTENHAESKGDLLKKECLLSVAEMENLAKCRSLFPFSPLDILRVEVLAVCSRLDVFYSFHILCLGITFVDCLG